MPYVYILTSDRTIRVYTGNLNRRLEEHNSYDNAGWTRAFKPWRIDAYAEVDNDAMVFKV